MIKWISGGLILVIFLLVLIPGVHAEEQYQYVTQWGSELTSPKNLDVDTTGNVYVLDSITRIQKFNSNGGFISKWYSYFGNSGLAVDNAGNIIMTDTEGARVFKFWPDGTEITHWGGFGQENGKFGVPYCVAVDTTGNVYVGDSNLVVHSRIQKFDSDGEYSGKWDAGSGEGGLPDLAVDTAGNVYVIDANEYQIQKFSSGGSLLKEWGSQGSGNGQFEYPNGVAVDTAGNVYVADTGNNRVQKFTSEGTFITKWGSSGTGNGEFDGPAKLAVDSSGNVYVLDTWNSRVQKFAKVELPTPLIFDAKCPVDISITDPEGNTISKLVNEIAGASYSETIMGSDNRLDVQVIIPDKKPGKYVITATARDLVSPEETFSLEVTSGGVTQIIVQDFPVGNIAGKTFGIDVSSDGIITISGSGGIPSPEFPSIALPVTMIIGFLGAVLFIQRTREH